MTFRDYAATWQTTVLPLKAEASQVTMRHHLQKHLLPAFGAHNLEELTNGAVQEWITLLANSHAPKTVKNLWATLRLILKSAHRDDLITRIPEPALPRVRNNRQAWYTLSELRRVLEAAEAAKPLVWLLAETGLRVGEVLGLTKDAVDFQERTLTVRQSVYKGKVQATKTQASDRILSISPQLAVLLSEQSQRSAQFLFGSRGGSRPACPDTLGDCLYDIHLAAAVDWKGIHAYRHANRSLMARLGIPDHIAEYRMGHAPQGIRGVYLHIQPGADREAAIRIADALGRRNHTKEEKDALWGER